MLLRCTKRCVSVLVLTFLSLILAACSGGGGGSSSSLDEVAALSSNQVDVTDSNEAEVADKFVVVGSVGDGPIVNADIRVVDALGVVIATGTSDAQANYELVIPAGTSLPVTVEASGGIDLVTQRAADFILRTVINEPGQQTVNISPMTTLASQAAGCVGDMSHDRIQQMWNTLANDLNMGWDTQRFGDPRTSVISGENVATAVLANEAMGEWVRRIGSNLSTTGLTLDDIVSELACDLADGALDGVAVSESSHTSRVLAVAKAVEVAIRLEVARGQLLVDGQDATVAMDNAIHTIMPSASSASVSHVGMSDASLEQLSAGLAVLQIGLDDKLIGELIDTLENEGREAFMQRIDTANVENRFFSFAERVALADEVEIRRLNERQRRQRDVLPPSVALSANPNVVAPGHSTTLSWTASNTDHCRASGDWQGHQDLLGTFATGAIHAPRQYKLTCTGLGGRVTRRVSVSLVESTPEPLPESPPTVSLSVDQASVNVGSSVTLSWSSTDATACSASGGWSGEVARSGEQLLGPLNANTTFTLSCTNSTGSALALVSVSAMGQLTLVWQAPTENVDGSAISGLSAYRIHYGVDRGEYDAVIEIPGTSIDYTFDLPVGDYYLAMTAVDMEGDESGFSNEVFRQAQ